MSEKGFISYHSYLKTLEPLSDAECGRLYRACLEYSMAGIEPDLRGNERILWPTMKEQIDRDSAKYKEKCEKLRANSAKGGEKTKAKWEPNGSQLEAKWPPIDSQMATNEKAKAKANANANATPLREINTPPKVSPPAEKRNAYGEYGWVKLTEKQHSNLLSKLGEDELNRCIRVVDESAQSSSNKNKWTDWNLVIQRCSRERWGYRASQPSQPKPKIFRAADYLGDKAGEFL